MTTSSIAALAAALAVTALSFSPGLLPDGRAADRPVAPVRVLGPLSAPGAVAVLAEPEPAAVPLHPPVDGAARGRWVAPVVPPTVLRRFDVGPHPWSPGHRGVDLAASPGTPLRAPSAGTVVFAGRVAGAPVVVLAHAAGLRSTFVPASSAVPRGGEVGRGAVFAEVGDAAGVPGAAGAAAGSAAAPAAVATAGATAGATTAATTGGPAHCPAVRPCVHWGVLRGEVYLDPLAFLRSGRDVVLLPP